MSAPPLLPCVLIFTVSSPPAHRHLPHLSAQRTRPDIRNPSLPRPPPPIRPTQEDGKVLHIAVEDEPPQVTVSSADSVLKAL